MKIELNKTYMTKRNIPVKITMKTGWGFFGTLQNDLKKSVKYNENGKVVGWKFGNMLDIKGSDEEEEEQDKPDWYKEAYDARKKKADEAKKEKLEKAKEAPKTPKR